MAWLKFDVSTPEKPEVLAITIAMGWDDPDLTVGKLLKVWRWFDQHTVEGNAPSVTPALLDRLIGVTGLTQAIANAGWLVVSEHGLQLPNFETHNGKTAKDRALTASRVAKNKSNGKGNAPSVTSALPREEKRREEKNSSVSKDTGDKSPLTPDEIIFGYGLPLLTNAGTSDKQARSFLGGLRKSHGDDSLVNALRDCLKAKPLQPLEWLAAVLPPSGTKSKPNKQEALEQRNKEIGRAWASKGQEVVNASI